MVLLQTISVVTLISLQCFITIKPKVNDNEIQHTYSSLLLFCSVVDCVWLEWSAWATCNTTCGGGYQQRLREVDGPHFGGAECVGSTDDWQECNTHNCPSEYQFIWLLSVKIWYGISIIEFLAVKGHHNHIVKGYLIRRQSVNSISCCS